MASADQTVIPETFWKDKQKSKARVTADKQAKPNVPKSHKMIRNHQNLRLLKY